MMLYEQMMDDCMFLEKKRVPDGLGGWKTEWVDGASFKAAIKKDNTLQARQAEKDGLTEVYTITVAREVPLDFHDVIKRLEDGQIFRVTSKPKDNQSPEFSTINFGQVSAETWALE